MKFLAGLTLSLFALAACAGVTPGPGGTPATTPGGPAGGGEEAVEIVDFGFDPAALDVSTGTAVTWTNTGAVPHTVTFDDGTVDSGNLASGATFEHTFDTAGTFDYFCSIHPTMTATVTVSE